MHKQSILIPFAEKTSLYHQQILHILAEMGESRHKMVWRQWKQAPLCFSLSLCCQARPGAERFFFEMVTRWFLLAEQPEVLSTFSGQFQFEEGGPLYIACEIVLALSKPLQIKWLISSCPLLEREVLLGVSSPVHASKILEMKGLSFDEKTGRIQEQIVSLVRKFPRRFDYDMLSDMHHFLLHLQEPFKLSHHASQMSRIIWVLYLFSKELEKSREQIPTKRHLRIKIWPVWLDTPFGSKEVLSLFVGLTFLKEHERFEERHLLAAVARLVSEARGIPGSYFEQKRGKEHLHGCFVEIEKKNGQPFDKAEKERLNAECLNEIKRSVEQLVPPIFMPRNEEEVMRNILTLSHQLKYATDLPQVILSFEEQTDAEIAFTVVLVRLLKKGSKDLRELLSQSALAGHLLFDRIKVVGSVRRRFPKEAAVFRAFLPSHQFLRQDYSVDLYMARAWVLQGLQASIGQLRDFNGGMIAKQRENFAALKTALGERASASALLLQNFFHAIFPVYLSTTLDPQLLKILFEMLCQAVERSESAWTEERQLEGRLFLVVKLETLASREKIFASLERLQIPFNELLTVQMQIQENFYSGFIYLEGSEEKQREFLEIFPVLNLN
jgi:hypothetical protein